MGVGADISNAKIYDIPVTMDMRIYTGRKKANTFFAFGFGYNMHIQNIYTYYSQDNHASGIVFNPSFGERIAINKKVAMSVGVGYKLLAVHYPVDFDGNKFELEHGVTFKIGIHF